VSRAELVVGWREWLRLPELGVSLIKAKVDTGARTSALHAENVRIVRRGDDRLVHFTIHPRQRSVKSSSGSLELRPVIVTRVNVGGIEWPIEITLTRRDVMGFRMLLGRQALRRHAIVDPGRSYVTRKLARKK